MVHTRLIHANHSFNHSLGRKVLFNSEATAASDLPGKLMFTQKPDHRLRNFFRVWSGNEQAALAILDDLSKRAPVERNRWNFVGHGGEQGIVECLKERRKQKHIQRSINVFDVLNKSGKDHFVLQTELPCERFELSAKRPVASKQKFGPRRFSPH